MFTTFLYILSIVSLLNFSHPFLFWFIMELNLMLFCLGVLSNLGSSLSNDSYSGVFFYFLVQCAASFLFIFLCFKEGLFIFGGMSDLLVPLMFFKLGLFPFHFWVFKFCFFMGSMETFLVLIVQKIPFLFFVFSADWTSLPILMLVSSGAGVVLIWKSKSLISILVSSSIYITLWLFLMLHQSSLVFLCFFIFYSVFTYVGCFFKFKTLSEINCSSTSSLVILVGLFLVGLPPLSFFFFKFFSVGSLGVSLSFIFAGILWLLAFGSMMGYFKLFFKFFFIGLKQMKTPQSVLPTILSLFFFFFFFF